MPRRQRWRGVSRQAILETVWSDTFVSDEVLTNAIRELRRALGDDSKHPRFIQTYPKKGYRLVEVATVSTEPSFPMGASLLVAGVLMMIGAIVIVWAIRSSPVEPEAPRRFVLRLGPSEPPDPYRFDKRALSSDGTSLVYVTVSNGRTELVLRRFDELEARRIRGSEDATFPFFSPDGQWIGFLSNPQTQGTVTGGELKKVPVSGGLPVTLATWRGTSFNNGAAWSDDDWIVFPSESDFGLSRISASGGTPEILTTVDHGTDLQGHGFPDVLPGSEAILFVVSGVGWRFHVAVFSLETGETSALVELDHAYPRPRYLPTGHLVYGSARDLMAVPFDVDELAITGPAVPMVENVNEGWTVSTEGTLVYQSLLHRRSLVWVNRRGDERPLAVVENPYVLVRMSRDGAKLALGQNVAGLWIYDLARESLTRLDTDRHSAWMPVWGPDGLRVAFATAEGLSWTWADGSGAVEPLSEISGNRRFPFCWSPDGKYLLFEESTPRGSDIRMLSLEEPHGLHDVIDAAHDQTVPSLSPDGRWLAYESNESGRVEVYVTAFPEAGRKWQISTAGGTVPVWGPSGRELFYRNARDMMRVPLETAPRFVPGKSEILFSGDYVSYPVRAYDIHPDGERFLMVKPDPDENTELQVVLNWFDDLKRVVPTKN